MSELTIIHARSVKDLTTPSSPPADLSVLDQVKLVAGNFPPEYAGNEAVTIGLVKELAAQGREAELEVVLQKITQEETRAKEVEGLLSKNKAEKTYVDSELESQNTKVNTQLSEQTRVVNTALTQLSTLASKFYPTLAEANADIANIAIKQPVQVGESGVNGGLYYKATAEATALTKSPHDPLTMANGYTDSSVNPIKKLIGEDVAELLEMAVDELGLLYRYIDSEGNVFYSGKKLEMRDWSAYTDDSTHVRVVLDRDSNVVAILDKDSNFRIAGDIIFGGGSLTEVLANASNLISPEKINLRIAGQTYQNALINRFPKRSEFTSVMTLEESNGLRNRMITGIKVPTGLFMVWHQQTAPQYDGDGNGSAFWCGFADIDSNYNITIRDRKLFISPDTPAGIIKHPHLGRTSDNRLILVYEKSIGFSQATPENPVDYIKYIKYSSDNGVTWTTPELLVFNNPAPTKTMMVFGTTSDILKLKTGRLIVGMYSNGGLCGCIYSDNDGASWSYSESWVSASNWGFEPAIALDSESNLVMSMRPKNLPNTAAFAKSVDDGENWKLMHTDRLVSSNNQSFLLYDDSIQAHLISHTTSAGWVRTKFRISISYDDCYTFPLTYAPFPDSKYVGYTQLIKWADGVYLLLMEYNDVWRSVNSNEQLGIQLINAKEVFNNVYRT